MQREDSETRRGNRFWPAVHAVFSLPLLRRWICWRGRRNGKKVAITFDDGPNPHTTPHVLRILRESGVRCTFFVLGREAAKHPYMLTPIAASGHEIGLHGYDHTGREFREQIRRCERELGRHVTCAGLFRPAMGRRGACHIPWLCLRGYTTVLWTFDAFDSMRHEGKHTAAPDYDRIRAGDIVLMHDDNPVCVAELLALIESLRKRGLQPTTVSDLIA